MAEKNEEELSYQTSYQYHLTKILKNPQMPSWIDTHRTCTADPDHEQDKSKMLEQPYQVFQKHKETHQYDPNQHATAIQRLFV